MRAVANEAHLVGPMHVLPLVRTSGLKRIAALRGCGRSDSKPSLLLDASGARCQQPVVCLGHILQLNSCGQQEAQAGRIFSSKVDSESKRIELG